MLPTEILQPMSFQVIDKAGEMRLVVLSGSLGRDPNLHSPIRQSENILSVEPSGAHSRIFLIRM